MTTLYKVWCTSKTFDDFFHETFLVSAPTRWKEKNQTFKKSKKKICCDTKKKRIFCCFSLLQSYKHLNLKKKLLFFFSFCFSSPGMFVSYFVQNRDKCNQIFWSHLELLKEDKHFVKKAPLPPPAPPIFVWATPTPKSPHPINRSAVILQLQECVNFVI